jgi:hypothetical protein
MPRVLVLHPLFVVPLLLLLRGRLCRRRLLRRRLSAAEQGGGQPGGAGHRLPALGAQHCEQGRRAGLGARGLVVREVEQLELILGGGVGGRLYALSESRNA